MEDNIQQNSFHLTCTGPVMCQITEYSRLLDGTDTDLISYSKFLLLLPCCGNATNPRGIPYGFTLPSADSGSTQSSSADSGVFIAKEVDRVGDKWSGHNHNGPDGLGFHSHQKQEMFPTSTRSTPTIRPTKPIQHAPVHQANSTCTGLPSQCNVYQATEPI